MQVLDFAFGLLSIDIKQYLLRLFVRYGLYGCPLDPVLFDSVPQSCNQQQSSPVVSNLTAPSLASKCVSSVSTSTVASTSEQVSWSSVNSSLASQGLLEVQPLHFVCCSTSDGARVERGDIQPVKGSLGPVGASVAVPFMASAMSMPPSTTLPTDSASLVALEQELQVLKVTVLID